MTLQDGDLDSTKKRKEIEKLEIEIGNAKKELGLERVKAWGAFLGPVMTAVTVLGTVYLGFQQISAKSDSDEDSNWRQTINAIDEIKPEDLGSRHVATLLKPFLESKRYRTLAIGVTIDELPRIRDTGTFNSLFKAAFPRTDAKELPILLDIARKLTGISSNLQEALNHYTVTDEKIAALKRDERRIVLNQAATLCEPITSILRNTDHRTLKQYFSSSQQKIPLSDIFFERCDFSGIDFSDIDLTNSSFDYVRLDDTVLKNIDNTSKYLWGGNIWWRAKEIDGPLLATLLKNFRPNIFPVDFPHVYRDGEIIEKEEWEKNIRRLCALAHLSYTDEQIQFPTLM